MPEFQLTADEARSYHEKGYLGPFRLCDESHINNLKDRMTALFNDQIDIGKPDTIGQINSMMQRGFGRHHDNPFLYELITRREIVDRITSILGADVLLWRSMFFVKEAGEKRIPWHQDLDDWPIEPYFALSVWIAIDEATAENGCVEVIPGSHRKFIPVVPTPNDVLDGFPRMANPACFDDHHKIMMELKPGEFFVFNERLLHQSASNQSPKRRMGLAVRFVPPIVRILDRHDRPVLVSGQDRMHFNQLVQPPDVVSA